MFCQWLPLHQLDLETLRSIVRAFVAVYPGGWAMLATNSLETPVVGLVALADSERLDAGRVRTRAEFGIDDELALLGSFIAGPRALARFAGNAPLNTDDRPVVAYSAPRITYVPDSLPRDRLIALLRELEISPDELVAALGRRRLALAAGGVLGGPQSLHRGRPRCAAHSRRAAHAVAGARAAPVGAADQPGFPAGLRSAAANGSRARAHRPRCRARAAEGSRTSACYRGAAITCRVAARARS